MKQNVMEVRNVTKKVKGRTLLDGLSFTVEKGDICGFIGPNGAGKTTLIRILTGLIAPTSGEVVVHGRDVQKEREAALMHLGAIVESPIFFSYLSGRKNLRNLARLHPTITKQEQHDRVEEVLDIVGLTGRADDKVQTYSLGMKQRLGIAQALLGKPKTVILDEPANGLDPMGMRELRQLILHLRKEYGITFFISSHLLDELQQMCSRLVIIKEGSLVWQGETGQLASENERLEDAFVTLMTT